MIRTLKLRFGRIPGVAFEPLDVTPVTVFVGPNNSGKSKILREIQRFCSSGVRSQTDLLLDELQFTGLSSDDALCSVDRVALPPSRNETLSPGTISVGKKNQRIRIRRDELIRAIVNPSELTDGFCSWFLKWNTLLLDGHNRIGLVSEQGFGDMQAPPVSSLQVLFQDDSKRGELRQLVKDAFGQYLVIDPTKPGRLRLRLSSREPANHIEERGLHAEAEKFHREALLIDESSDGVKAYTGILLEIIAGDPIVLLVDEPEAFLHPSLSFKLGQNVAQAAKVTAKRIFASTHSPYFVMGCIQSGTQMNIVRLTYRDGSATARVLPNDEILHLMRDPLLRSTNVISGLFYEAVVVTEGDADRAFYQEINERLLRNDMGRGIPNCLFINAQNKQTIRRIVQPLRKLGIPAAAIVDIDIIKDGGVNWQSFLEAAAIPSLDRESFGCQRSRLGDEFRKSGKDMKTDGGVEILNDDNRESANNLFDRLAEYGLFIVRRGELEKWLGKLNVRGHGPEWLISVFEKMGEDPSVSEYVHPSVDDVWAFLESVRKWAVDPHRKGVPN